MPTPKATPCPSRDALRHLLRDASASDVPSAAAEHIGACADCQRALEGLLGDTSDVLGVVFGAGRVSDDSPPEFPGCEPLGRIGAGGMGVVWRVRDLEFGRVLAAKVLNARGCDNPHLLRRFL